LVRYRQSRSTPRALAGRHQGAGCPSGYEGRGRLPRGGVRAAVRRRRHAARSRKRALRRRAPSACTRAHSRRQRRDRIGRGDRLPAAIASVAKAKARLEPGREGESARPAVVPAANAATSRSVHPPSGTSARKATAPTAAHRTIGWSPRRWRSVARREHECDRARVVGAGSNRAKPAPIGGGAWGAISNAAPGPLPGAAGSGISRRSAPTPCEDPAWHGIIQVLRSTGGPADPRPPYDSLTRGELLMSLLPRGAWSAVPAPLVCLAGPQVAGAQEEEAASVRNGAVPAVAVKRGTRGTRLFSRGVSVPLFSCVTGVPA